MIQVLDNSFIKENAIHLITGTELKVCKLFHMDNYS